MSAIRLASQGRSTAVVSETLHSNSLNLVFGLCLPAVIIATPSPNAIALVVFLPGLTLLGLILTGRSGGLRSTGGLRRVRGGGGRVGALGPAAHYPAIAMLHATGADARVLS